MDQPFDWKLNLIAAIICLIFTPLIGAQDEFRHHHNGQWHSHPHTNYHYHYPNTGYRPVVQWFPSGTWMNVGPVNAYQVNGRRYIRFGVNYGFSRYQGYSTFNYRTGETRHYRR